MDFVKHNRIPFSVNIQCTPIFWEIQYGNFGFELSRTIVLDGYMKNQAGYCVPVMEKRNEKKNTWKNIRIVMNLILDSPQKFLI